MSSARDRRLLPVALLVAAGVLAGCGSPAATDGAPPPAAPSPTPAATGTPSRAADDRPRAPLTGLPVEPDVAVRTAVAVPVSGESPTGLDRADVVLEEIARPTRRVAIFQSRDADSVGPVGPTRPTDPMALGVLKPVYAFNGGTTGQVDQVEASPLVPVNALRRGELFSTRSSARYASTAAVRKGVQAGPSTTLFSYADGEGPPAGSRRVSAVTVTLPGGGTQSWTFDPAARLWRRVAGGPAAAVTNLVVQVVPYKVISLGRYGGEGLSARVVGGGAATVLAGQDAVSARWLKRGVVTATNYLDADSVPVRLVPGTTWLLLAPTGARVDLR